MYLLKSILFIILQIVKINEQIQPNKKNPPSYNMFQKKKTVKLSKPSRNPTGDSTSNLPAVVNDCPLTYSVTVQSPLESICSIQNPSKNINLSKISKENRQQSTSKHAHYNDHPYQQNDPIQKTKYNTLHHDLLGESSKIRVPLTQMTPNVSPRNKKKQIDSLHVDLSRNTKIPASRSLQTKKDKFMQFQAEKSFAGEQQLKPYKAFEGNNSLSKQITSLSKTNQKPNFSSSKVGQNSLNKSLKSINLEKEKDTNNVKHQKNTVKQVPKQISGLTFSFKPLYQYQTLQSKQQSTLKRNSRKSFSNHQQSRSKSSTHQYFQKQPNKTSKYYQNRVQTKKQSSFVSIFDSLALRNSQNLSQNACCSSLSSSHKYNSFYQKQERNNFQMHQSQSKKAGQPRQESVKVYVRIKPSDVSCDIFNQSSSKSQKTGKQVFKALNNQMILMGEKLFAFDQVFLKQSQSYIFDITCQPLLKRLFQGYNATLFAYGQTGSGKTHTIFGNSTQCQQGLVPRTLQYLLLKQTQNQGQNESFQLKCSLVQVYKESVYDLFAKSHDKRKQLKVKEDKVNGVYLEDIQQKHVGVGSDIQNTLELALQRRKISTTKMNQNSSRSHTILTLKLVFSGFETRFSLIDLAGSQKVRKSEVRGENFEETKKINYSLSCLGNVINALTTRSSLDHIPFRDSKLTRLLKDSLCGKFSTSVIVTCAQGQAFAQQTLSSLKFAQRAKNVKLTPQNQLWLVEEKLRKASSLRQSVDMVSSVEMGSSIDYYQQKIQELVKELQQTKDELSKYKSQQGSATHLQQKQNVEKQVTSQTKHSFRNNIGIISQVQLTHRSLAQETQGQLTARMAIPSQRANVAQMIGKYQWQKSVLMSKKTHPVEFIPEQVKTGVKNSKQTQEVHQAQRNEQVEYLNSSIHSKLQKPIQQISPLNYQDSHQYLGFYDQFRSSHKAQQQDQGHQQTNLLNEVISLNVSNTVYNLQPDNQTGYQCDNFTKRNLLSDHFNPKGNAFSFNNQNQANSSQISIELSELTSERICSSTQRRQRKIVCMSSSKNSDISFSFEPLVRPSGRGQDSLSSTQRTQKGRLPRRTFR